MNSLAFFSRVARHTSSPVLANVPLDVAQCLVSMANLAFTEVLALLPPRMRRTEGSVVFPAPATYSISNLISQDAISLTPSLATRAGQGIVIATDGRLNRLVYPNCLMSPFLGTVTTQSATVYGDSAAVNASIFHMCSDIVLSDSAGALVYPQHYDGGLTDTGDEPFRTILVGEPQYWRIWTMAGSTTGASTPLNYLQVWPFPAVKYRGDFRAEWSPTPFVQDDTTIARELPLPENVWDALCALTEAKLTNTRFWAFPELADGIRKDADRALAVLRQFHQPAFTGTQHRVGTPRGF